MEKKVIWIVGIVILIALVFTSYIYLNPNEPLSGENFGGENFKVDSIFLKTVIKPAGSFDKQIKVSNLKNSLNHFEISLIDLVNLSFPEINEFDLDAKEQKDLNFIFSNAGGRDEGIYAGGIIISDLDDEKVIPVILEIESDDVLFDSNTELYPKSKIHAGDNVNVDVRVFDLSKIGEAILDVTSFVKNFDGETLISDSENFVVSGNEFSFTKTINLQDDLEPGKYLFGIVLDYKGSIGTSSQFFIVEEKNSFEGFDLGLGNNILVYFLILFAFMFLVFMVVIFYFIYSRDKFMRELTAQYRAALKNQDVVLKKKEEETESKLKTKEERKVSKRLFRQVRKKRRAGIKQVYKARKKELKKLRKSKKKSKIQEQISKWKKSGFDTDVLESKAKTPDVNDIRKEVGKWKKQGIDTGVLDDGLKKTRK